MNITATEAKNRFGHVLEQAQTRPVFIDKAGRRHSVVLSIRQYEALLTAGDPKKIANADQFYERYKDWIDEQTRHFHEHGLWNDDLRTW